MKIPFLENEFWYGGCVKYGLQMPFGKEMNQEFDFSSNNTPNQAMPILLSTQGRIIWANQGFSAKFEQGNVIVPDFCTLEQAGNTLKEAYLYATKKYFPFEGKMPHKELFEKVIYNTWIELTFFQNQKDILHYAKQILKHDMPAGVLMIDDGWSEYYGEWQFHSGKFPNPSEMISQLKEMGFRLMLWVCPFISPDSVRFREAEKLDILIKNADETTLITQWWNGYSAVLDCSNPTATEWLKKQLDALVELGVDGFKFDAGDSMYYPADAITYGKTTPDEQSYLWAKFGSQYEFNEYRVTFKAGGLPLLQRLCDKQHSWGDHGIASLVPDTLLQGLTGHPFGCPDMIGGGEYLNFQDVQEKGLDEELFVRHAEIACLLPAMQFSVAPFRILGEESFHAIQKSIQVRNQYLQYILELVEKASQTGEPIVRYMEYEFPHQGLEKIKDQFMLGERYLIAPVYEKDQKGRSVAVPKGDWLYKGEKITSGGQVFLDSIWGEPIVLEKV